MCVCMEGGGVLMCVCMSVCILSAFAYQPKLEIGDQLPSSSKLCERI